MTKKAIYAGTFDPFTNGHLDIAKRALEIFDEVTILLAVSPAKSPVISRDDRLNLLTSIFENEKRIKVDIWDGLIVDYAKNQKINTIIRGLRPTGDFEIEFQMATMNKKLYPQIDTIFFMTGSEHYYVSSTLIREIIRRGGDVSEFVPAQVLTYLKNHLK